jgi:hypothetical protein
VIGAERLWFPVAFPIKAVPVLNHAKRPLSTNIFVLEATSNAQFHMPYAAGIGSQDLPKDKQQLSGESNAKSPLILLVVLLASRPKKVLSNCNAVIKGKRFVDFWDLGEKALF